MVRPKLVEEGVPIGSTLRRTNVSDDGTTVGDHTMMEEASSSFLPHDHHLRHNPHSHHQPHHQHHQHHQQHYPQHHQHNPSPQHYSNYAATQYDASTVPQHQQYHPPPQSQSSLLRAVGGQIMSTRKKNPTHATHIVIGGEEEWRDTAVYMEDADGGSHSQHHGYYPPSAQDPLTHADSHHHVALNTAAATTQHHLASNCHHGFATTPYQLSQPQQEYPPRGGSVSSHNHYQPPSHRQQQQQHHPATVLPSIRTHIEIGADYRMIEKMEGVEDHSIKGPLVVVDGANVAYAYAQAMHDAYLTNTTTATAGDATKLEPDVRGIRVACRYFASSSLSNVRVLVVLPQSWLRRKPAVGSMTRSSSAMDSDVFFQQIEQRQVLDELQRQGQLVAAPPTDDDDAYALQIAQRENARALQRSNHSFSSGQCATGMQGPAYVLSNDLFRDAQQRDSTGQLRQWLNSGIRILGNNDSDCQFIYGPGRISFAFADMGCIDDRGDRELDIVPNPRHPLVSWVEQHHGVHDQSL